MHEMIAFLKDAVSRSDDAGIMGCYIVADNNLHCRNSRMHAGVAMDSPVNFNVPAPALDAALARMKDIESLTVDDGLITIKCGRLSSKIKLDPSEPPAMPELPKKWRKVPAGFVDALDKAKDHVGEQGWTTCVRLKDDRVTAFCSQSGIDVTVKGLKLESAMLMPEIVKFLIDQGGADEYAQEENAICWRWDDGRWLRTQLYTGTFGDGPIDTLFDNVGTQVPIKITAEFKDALADAFAMTDKIVQMTPNGFAGRTGGVDNPISHNTVDFKIKGLPKDHVSYWDKDYLEPVMKVATAWNPLTWPAPCYYEGDGFRGIVMGRSRW
jgi:hypothetical protein